jgi:hypothetical protein
MFLENNTRRPEPPQYEFNGGVPGIGPTGSAGGGSNMGHSRRKGISPALVTSNNNISREAAISVHCSPFSCTGRLKLLKLNSSPSPFKAPSSSTNTVAEKSTLDTTAYIAATDDTKPAATATTLSSKSSSDGSVEFEILQAVGVGGTKREARHVASAGLLKRLFPECKDMVQVKAAAMAARERYDVSKALKFAAQKIESRRYLNRLVNSITGSGSNSTDEGVGDLDSFALASPTDPPLPASIRKEFQNLQEGHCGPVNTTDPAVRQVSRQKQLYAFVDSALQSLNERDEEGRCLPEVLTEDDVGRTVLRRAEPEDLPRVLKLLSTSHGNHKKKNQISGTAATLTLLGPVSVLAEGSAFVDNYSVDHDDNGADDDDDNGTRRIISDAAQSWSCCTVVLLLCRAITAYEDPPLGCAVLTYGFSMQQGKLFRVAHLAAEPHLPKERFFECLQDFCHFAKCTLHVEEAAAKGAAAANYRRFSCAELRGIIQSHLADRCHPTAPAAAAATSAEDDNNSSTHVGSGGSSCCNSRRLASLSLAAAGAGSSGGTARSNNNTTSSLLSSVREESEASDESGSDKRASPSTTTTTKSGAADAAAQHRSSKPSKRTRVE